MNYKERELNRLSVIYNDISELMTRIIIYFIFIVLSLYPFEDVYTQAKLISYGVLVSYIPTIIKSIILQIKYKKYYKNKK